jgi:hypothetical protein
MRGGGSRGSVAQLPSAAVWVALPLSRAHPRPLALTRTHALTLGSAGCCAAGCRCSHFLFLPPAGQRHILHLQGIPRSAANSALEPALGVATTTTAAAAAAAPGTCAGTRVVGAFASRPRAAVGPLPTRECPRLFEVPLLKKREMSHTLHASELL